MAFHPVPVGEPVFCLPGILGLANRQAETRELLPDGIAISEHLGILFACPVSSANGHALVPVGVVVVEFHILSQVRREVSCALSSEQDFAAGGRPDAQNLPRLGIRRDPSRWKINEIWLRQLNG